MFLGIVFIIVGIIYLIGYIADPEYQWQYPIKEINPLIWYILIGFGILLLIL